MPVKVKRIGDKYRIVEAENERIARFSTGSPVDQGGYSLGEKGKALKKVAAVNANL